MTWLGYAEPNEGWSYSGSDQAAEGVGRRLLGQYGTLAEAARFSSSSSSGHHLCAMSGLAAMIFKGFLCS